MSRFGNGNRQATNGLPPKLDLPVYFRREIHRVPFGFDDLVFHGLVPSRDDMIDSPGRNYRRWLDGDPTTRVIAPGRDASAAIVAGAIVLGHRGAPRLVLCAQNRL